VPSQFSRTTNSLASDTSHWALAAWTLGVLLLAAWLTWFTLARVTVYEISSKARIEVQQAAHAVVSVIPGRIATTRLVIGQEVRAGDILVELDVSSEQLRRTEEETRLAAIPVKIHSLRAEIALLESAKGEDEHAASAAADGARQRIAEAAAAVDFARSNELRLKAESDAGGVARVEALRAMSEMQKLSASREALAADVRKLEAEARTRVRQQQAQIEGLRRALATLDNEADMGRATIARLTAEIDKHIIRAPVAGRLGEIAPLRTGGYVAEGQKLATVVPSGDVQILADFDPISALGRLSPGQRARMRLKGFPWAQYGTISATVSRVASEIRDDLVRVELEVDTATLPSALMRHGLAGTVEVGVEETSPAILVLRAAGQALTRTPASASEARSDTERKP